MFYNVILHLAETITIRLLELLTIKIRTYEKNAYLQKKKVSEKKLVCVSGRKFVSKVGSHL